MGWFSGLSGVKKLHSFDHHLPCLPPLNPAPGFQVSILMNTIIQYLQKYGFNSYHLRLYNDISIRNFLNDVKANHNNDKAKTGQFKKLNNYFSEKMNEKFTVFAEVYIQKTIIPYFDVTEPLPCISTDVHPLKNLSHFLPPYFPISQGVD